MLKAQSSVLSRPTRTSLVIVQADQAANDEQGRLDADEHYNDLKSAGELERRRIERAGPSFYEQQMNRDYLK